MSTLSFVIPTRDRPKELQRTLEMVRNYPRVQLGGNPPEVMVIDNGSKIPATQAVPVYAPGEIRVVVIRLEENRGTAARNIGAEHATGDWIIMLDDDSAPVRGDFVQILGTLSKDIAAIGGEITLPSGARESGGLPEVVIGCGCAVRRDTFLSVGGYDESFGYYAEEYDLCAKLISAGHRVTHTRQIAFEHRKVVSGRDFGEIMFKLVRNNTWVLARHAPDRVREQAISLMLDRYREIAAKEGVLEAYERAFDVAKETIADQPYTPLSQHQWRRFTGAHAIERVLIPQIQSRCIQSVALVARGKGDDVVERELINAGILIDEQSPEKVIATLSPGPMLDAADQFGSAWVPWQLPMPSSASLGEI